MLVLGYSQGGHVAWLLAATGRFEVVIPVSGALAPGYQDRSGKFKPFVQVGVYLLKRKIQRSSG